MVVFLAAAKERVPELRQAIRSRLAWQSILDEKGEHQLNLTPSDVSQVTTRLKEADQTVGLRIGETFCQVLYPVQPPGESKVRWSNVRVSGGAGLSERVVRKLESSEHLISTYSGIRIRRDLDRKDAPLWNGDHVGIRDLWSYYCRYLYMPRLAGFGALSAAISRGVADLNWQSDTFACAESYDPEADRYPGLKAGEQVEITTSYAAVLVRSGRAAAQLHTESRSAETEAEVPAHVGEAGKLSVAVPARRRPAFCGGPPSYQVLWPDGSGSGSGYTRPEQHPRRGHYPPHPCRRQRDHHGGGQCPIRRVRLSNAADRQGERHPAGFQSPTSSKPDEVEITAPSHSRPATDRHVEEALALH